MASSLCDWDTLAVDNTGMSVNGISPMSPGGVRMEVYENFLVFRDEQSWRPTPLNFPRPVVASIHDGEITYQDFTVRACRGPQAGIFFTAWFVGENDLVSMSGCAVDGWMRLDGQREETYQGVLPSSVDYLYHTMKEWIASGAIPYELDAPLAHISKALRFNQGDAYVAQRSGGQTPNSLPGYAQVPQAIMFWKNLQPQGK